MAISEDTATVMNKLLQTVVYGSRGTGAAARNTVKDMKIFAKTGTSNNSNDLWFVGGTPYYVGSCWCGYDEQQNMIETDLHANKYDAMIIAPLQGDMATTLVSGTDMPIFAIDTDFNAPEKISFIGIGQKDAAASGGAKAVEAAKAAGWDKIEAAYIAGVQGDSTADARRTGFQEGIDGAGGTFLADEVQYADAVADKATVCMEGIMQSHPEGLAIIACHNDDCAIAAARAAANNPAYAKTIFIGFDGNITAAQSILDGGETMTVAQSGYDQGYQAVKTVVAHLNGEKVDSFVDCGTNVIDSTTAEDYMATLKSQMDGKAVAQ